MTQTKPSTDVRPDGTLRPVPYFAAPTAEVAPHILDCFLKVSRYNGRLETLWNLKKRCPRLRRS